MPEETNIPSNLPDTEIIFQDKKTIKTLSIDESLNTGTKWLAINHVSLEAQKMKTIRLHSDEVEKLIKFWNERRN